MGSHEKNIPTPGWKPPKPVIDPCQISAVGHAEPISTGHNADVSSNLLYKKLFIFLPEKMVWCFVHTPGKPGKYANIFLVNST